MKWKWLVQGEGDVMNFLVKKYENFRVCALHYRPDCWCDRIA